MAGDVSRSRFVAQGLASGRATPSDVGWVRALGGAEPYLSLSARQPGLTVAGVSTMVDSGALRVVPAVRGCMYLVPAADVPLALSIAAVLGAKRAAKDLKDAGLSEADVDVVQANLLAALALAPGTTVGLKKRVAGGKALPFALRALELAGRVWRKPEGARLDHERYEWHLVADPSPIPELDLPALMSRYAQMAGPSDVADLRAWSGLSARDTRGYAALPAERVDAPSRTVLLPGLDAFYGLYSSPTGVDADLADVEVSWFSSAGRGPLGGSNQPLERTVVRDGRVVGLWAWNPDIAEIEVAPLRSGVEVEAAEVDRVVSVFRELGHARAFVLDTEESLRARLERVRRAGSR